MSDQGRALGHQSRWTVSPVDVLFAVVLVGTIVVWVTISGDRWFFLDEWPLLLRGQTPGDFLQPYNGHLSITYIAVYRAHAGLFGVDHYWVLIAISTAALAAVPLLLYLTSRNRVGAPAAAAMGIAVLWATEVSFESGAMNHWGALALTVAFAYYLAGDRPSDDLKLGVLLALTLATSGGGVVLLPAMAIHNLLTRAGRRRWIALLVPAITWFAWYRWLSDIQPIPANYQLSRTEQVKLIFEGEMEALKGVAFGSEPGAWVLLALLVAVVILRIRSEGARALIPLVTWGSAVAAWWIGLAQSRGIMADPEAFRYRFVAVVLTFLALLPPRPTGPEPSAELEADDGADEALPAQTSKPEEPKTGDVALLRWSGTAAMWAAAGGLAVLTGLLYLSNIDGQREGGEMHSRFGRTTRDQTRIALADPPVLASDYRFGVHMGYFSQDEMTGLARRYGPAGSSGSSLDEWLANEFLSLDQVTASDSATPCDPWQEGPVAEERARMRTDDEPVNVEVRRFGDQWISIGEIPADSSARLLLPHTLPDTEPWSVRAQGACTADG